MDRITVYRITVYTGAESLGTLHAIHGECIALHDTKNLERAARSIMAAHNGDEVDCYKITSALVTVMD